MGGSPSRPPLPPPPVVRRDPKPARPPIEGLSIGTSQGCRTGSCVLGIAQGISASSVKMYRQYGDISRDECEQLTVDINKVIAKEMSLDELKTGLLAGKYYEKQDNGYCAQLMTSEDELTKDTTVGPLMNNSKFRRPKIRKMTDSGGFSSLTKAILKPSIPFKVTWDGQEIAVDTMTLYHPSPIRIENVQHDAMLTLNDPADPEARLVVLVPLKGSALPGKSGEFIAKIATYLPGVLQPNPATGQYEAVDVPTGNDWNLSKMFPGKPQNGQNVVTTGVYAWNSLPPMEEYIKSQSPSLIEYGWRPMAAVNRPAYVMLDQAIPVNAFDLQTIRMLPVTDANNAIDPPAKDSVSYRGGDCTATSAAARPPATTTREGFSLDEGADACDPFANMPETGPDPSLFITILISIVSALAVFIGVYYAMKHVTTWKGDIFKMGGEFLGKQVAQLSKMKPKALTPSKDRTFMSSLASATGAADIGAPEPEPEKKKEEDTTFSVDNPLIPKEKREFIEKKIAEKKKKEEEKKAAEEKKAEEDKAAEEKKKEEQKAAEEKKKEEEKAAEEKKKEEARAEASKRGLVRRDATRSLVAKEDTSKEAELKKAAERLKYLDTYPSDMTEAEQRKERAKLQRITGEYRSTKQEQREAAGTGLFKFDAEGKPIRKRKIAIEEPDEEPPTDQEPPTEQELKELDQMLKDEREREKAEQEKAEREKKAETEKAKHDALVIIKKKIEKSQEEFRKKIMKNRLELADKIRKDEAAKYAVKVAKEKEAEIRKQNNELSRTLPAVPPPALRREEQAAQEVVDARLDSEQIARDLAAAQSRLNRSKAEYAQARMRKGGTRRRVVQ